MTKKVANIDHDTGKLISEHGFGHKGQPKGKSIGADGAPFLKTSDGSSNPKMNHGGSSFVFRRPPATGADRFHVTKGEGLLRHSGEAGAHQVGKRTK